MSVYKRPGSEIYQCEFTVKGHRIRRSTGKKSKREAQAEERRIKVAAREEIEQRLKSTKHTKLTLDQGFGRYWNEKSLDWAPKWQEEVQRYIREILARMDNNMAIEDLTDADVNDYVQQRISEGQGQYANNRTLAVLRGMHRRARKKWGQKTQEIDWSDHLNPEHKRVAHLTLEQVRQIIDVLPLNHACAVEWSIYTGVRKFECYGQLRECIYPDRGYAEVIRKGGTVRRVLLSPQALDVVTRAPNTGRYLFDKTGRRYAWERALARCGLEEYRWHDLRHTHATWLRQGNVSVEVVQRSLDHAKLETTMRYTHVEDNEVRDALANLPTIGTHTPSIIGINSLKKVQE